MLTILQIKNAKAQIKPYQLSDGKGLFLRVMPKGRKSWIINKSLKGQRISKMLGTFPEVSLKEARASLELLLADNSVSRKQMSFAEVYTEWLEIKKSKIKNWDDTDRRLQRYILPYYSARSFCSIEPFEIIATLKKSLLKQEKYETIKRICGPLKEIEVYALNCGYIQSLKLQGIQSAFPAPASTSVNRPSVPWQELPQTMKELQVASVRTVAMRSVILIAFYTLLRPNEYCSMEWSWIDDDMTSISVPARVMKMKKGHRVPVSSQLRSLLNSIPRVSKYVLCSTEDLNKPFTTNAMGVFLRRHGFRGRLVPHGIRSIGRTWMHDNGIAFDVAEKCLAHSVGTTTQLAYDRTDLFDKRCDAMQRWCDYVESCL